MKIISVCVIDKQYKCLPPPNNVSHDSNQETTKHEEKPKGRCQRILTNVKDKVLCKSCRKGSKPIPVLKHDAEADRPGCFSCNKNKRKSVRISIEDEDPKPTFWERIKCCGKNKITDTSGCLPIGRRKPSWVGRRDSILSDVPKQSDKCSKLCCKLFMRRLFCLNCCKSKKKIEEDAFSRRASTMSKKKSLTLTGPVEDHKPKLDLSLVEHTSHMKAAIPVLPACLAWFCLIMNCLFPGTGTILSGLFCLCIGKPRFSQKDGARPRIGAFIINLIIGFGQFFTVLFCLVGWGWSIWWGVIMVRLARKSRKVDAIAKAELDSIPRPVPAKQNHRPRDPELGS